LLKIVLDAVGGDYAPLEVLKGAILAVQEFPVHLILVGPEDVILSSFSDPFFSKSWPHERISIHHAPEVVGMGESPSVSYRKKKQSSIQEGLRLVSEGKADAFVSAGNTGAVMMASTFILGRIDTVERPAIAAILPTEKNPVVVLDVGSSVDCKPEHLVQFAEMGDCFCQLLLGVDVPRVGLLNIGEEVEKGNQQTQDAYSLLEASSLNFVGNVESKYIFKGSVDVVVCDGFVGNALLKFGEGVSGLFINFFKSEANGSLRSKLGLLLLKPMLKRFIKRYDHEQYGGAPLLGLNGVSIIAHGSSSAIAIKHAVRSAIQSVEGNIVSRIAEKLRS
jgi:glycerol-3-phosphate acyltransferase PlsX